MKISLNWIRDYVDLPTGLDPRALAERFTRTTAEVEDVTRVELGAAGILAARIVAVEPVPRKHHLRLVTLESGPGRTVQTVSAAPVLTESACVLFAPPGTTLTSMGPIASTKVAGISSQGLILPGSAVGMELAAQEAVFTDPTIQPGDTIAADLFDDWIIEIDNKSLTHRPDLWGHYGIAREIAAIAGVALKPFPVAPLRELTNTPGPTVEIDIQDSDGCHRFSAVMLEGVPTQPAPLWMQLRLGRIGLRPISGLVDLTNYIMMDLGQPMHAYDGDKVPRIEVGRAAAEERFRTLDGVERILTPDDLMIKRDGESIGIAGVMGGLDTEVTEHTSRLLLEAANFDAAAVRRTATRLGLRTDASARFEKSLDPANTVLSIQRFVHLAQHMYPRMSITRPLSDAHPRPVGRIVVGVIPAHVATVIGREVRLHEAATVLTPLGFEIEGATNSWEVHVPSFRATGDVSIEADIIEELARCMGYDTIAPAMPHVATRQFDVNPLHELQQRTLAHFTHSHCFHETHGYLWYDTAWIDQLGFDPGECVELVNPASEGLGRFRQTLIPGLLGFVTRNRFHFPEFSLMELGSVFEKTDDVDGQFHHLALVSSRRGKNQDADVFGQLKGAMESWAWELFGRRVTFDSTDGNTRRPWEHQHLTVNVLLDGHAVGRASVLDLTTRRAMDDHLSAWSVCWAELRLDELLELPRATERLGTIPEHPVVELDYTILVPRSTAYASVSSRLATFADPLLKCLQFVTSFDGGGPESDRRALTFRATIGAPRRTLSESDVNEFRNNFQSFITQCQYQLQN